MSTWFCSLAALLCTISVSAVGQKVDVDWDRGNNFSRYTTYAWATSRNPIQDPLWNQRVISLVDGQLTAKGLQKVGADANPSLIVVCNAGIKQSTPLAGYRMGWWDATGSLYTVTQDEGTLIVDLADPQLKMMVWRGMAQQALSSVNTQKNMSSLQKVVTKMFKDYPR